MAEDKPIVAPINARKPKSKTGAGEWFPSTKTLAGATKAAQQSATAAGLICFSYALAIVLTYVFGLKWFDSSPSQADLIVDIVVAAFALLLSWRGAVNPGPIKSIFILIWVALEFVWKIENVAAKYPASLFINVIATVWAFNGVRGAFALRKLRKRAAAAAG